MRGGGNQSRKRGGAGSHSRGSRHRAPIRRAAPRLARRQHGFIYMALVVFFGVFAIFAGSAMISGGILQRRNAEEQLIFVGGEFRNAIKSYYDAGAAMPPGASRYPARLEDLLADPRAPELRRHLRQIYPDPLTGRQAWGTVAAPDGGIMGVYSLSPAKAVKMFGFPPEFKNFEGKTKIADWVFAYPPPPVPALLSDVPAAADPVPAAPALPPGTAPAGDGQPSAQQPAPQTTPQAAPQPAAPQPAAPPSKLPSLEDLLPKE